MDENRRNGKARVKTARMFFHFLLFFLLGTLLWYPAAFLVEKAFYPTLCDLFPKTFREYNFVTEKAAYAALLQKKQFSELLITLFSTSAAAFRFDNARYEYTVSETDGQYRLADGVRLWMRSFSLTDLIAAVLSPIPLFALLYLPEEFFARYAPKFLLNGTSYAASLFGNVGGYLFTVGLLLLCESAAMLYSLGRYRVSWLSAFAE